MTENLIDRVPDNDRPYISVAYNGGTDAFTYTGDETDPTDIAGEVWDLYSAFGVSVYRNATDYAAGANPLVVADHKGNIFSVPETTDADV